MPLSRDLRRATESLRLILHFTTEDPDEKGDGTLRDRLDLAATALDAAAEVGEGRQVR